MRKGPAPQVRGGPTGPTLVHKTAAVAPGSQAFWAWSSKELPRVRRYLLLASPPPRVFSLGTRTCRAGRGRVAGLLGPAPSPAALAPGAHVGQVPPTAGEVATPLQSVPPGTHLRGPVPSAAASLGRTRGGAGLARGPVWETRRDTAALPEEGEPLGEALLKATHRPPGTQEADVHGASGSGPGGISLGPGHPGPHS